jgi:Lipid A 3-O-deacylase (PagL)
MRERYASIIAIPDTAKPVSASMSCARALLPRALPELCAAAVLISIPGACLAEGLLAPCEHCNVLIGAGTTFRTFAWTDGLVLPVTLELDDSRWELGAFRFATAQRFAELGLPPSLHSTNPYWGFTAMRRWQVLHRSRFKLYFGFGANYKTETDHLDGTRWNFAYLLAVRFDLDAHGRLLELGIRHWSNAWIKQPNNGQNILTLSVAF